MSASLYNQSIQRTELQPWLKRSGPDRVVVINDLSFARGGATGVALNSVDLLRQRGVPVTLITGESAPDVHLADGADIVGVGCEHILNSPVSVAGFRGLYNHKAYRTISDWVARNDTPNTIYHLHGWSKILSPSVFLALRPVARRVVASAHDFFLVCPNGGYFDFQNTQPCALAPMSVSCLTRNCDRRNFHHKVWRSFRQFIGQTFRNIGHGNMTVVAVHEGMLAHLEFGGIERSQLRVLHNPVTPWRSERVLAENNECFVYVGRLEADKGVDLLAEAATQAGVKLRVIGQGPLSDMPSTRYPSIEQAGWRDRSEIPDLINDARALVMPTRGRETFGLAAMEAMTSGLPVVASKNAMIAEEIHRRGFGLSCDPFDITALSDALRRLANDNLLVQRMSQRAYDGARALALSPEDWVEALLEIYLDILRCGGKTDGIPSISDAPK